MSSRTAPARAQVLSQAAALQQRGRFAEAERLCRKVLDRDPGDAGALELLGVIDARQGKLESAAGLLRRAADRAPGSAEIRNNLGLALHGLGENRAAADCFTKAIALNPRYAIAHNNLGLALNALSRRDEAIACHEKALAISPGYAEAMNNLGSLLHAARRFPQALGWFEKAVAARPGFAEAHSNMGKTLSALGRHGEALARFERAASLQPGLAAGEVDIGTALCALNRHGEAMRHFEKACGLDPARALPVINLGIARQEAGQLAEARRCFEQAVALEPRNPAGYAGLVGCIKVGAGDPHLAAMEDLAKDGAGLAVADRAALLFALGKALSDTGEHRRAFAHYLEANALRRGATAYNEAATIGRLDRVRAVFSAELMRAREGLGDPSASADLHHRHAAVRIDLGRADPGEPPAGLRRRGTHGFSQCGARRGPARGGRGVSGSGAGSERRAARDPRPLVSRRRDGGGGRRRRPSASPTNCRRISAMPG